MSVQKNVNAQQICVVGLGYIGLPTAVLATQSGYNVYGFDIDREKVARINAGDAPIFEPELEHRLRQAIATGNFKASDEIRASDCFIVAVPTPFKEGRKADLTYVFNAGTMIARVLTPGTLVILESTVPVGTTKRFAQLLEDISGLQCGKDFFVAYCPERVLPGHIFKELVHNDRIVGGIGKQAAILAQEFYKRFVVGEIYLTDVVSAEMVKLIENSSRDVQIAFANQVAAMCEQAGIDPFQVIELANKHPRVNILNPGCGVGGHCIAVDPWFLVETFPHHTNLLKTARIINDAKPHQVIEKVIEMVQEFREKKGGKHERPQVFVMGATYKPNIDDLRESPALKIIQELAQKNMVLDLSVCEPHVEAEKIAKYRVEVVQDIWKGLAKADIVVASVKHTVFEQITHSELQGKAVLDACGLLHTISKKADMLLPLVGKHAPAKSAVL